MMNTLNFKPLADFFCGMIVSYQVRNPETRFSFEVFKPCDEKNCLQDFQLA